MKSKFFLFLALTLICTREIQDILRSLAKQTDNPIDDEALEVFFCVCKKLKGLVGIGD